MHACVGLSRSAARVRVWSCCFDVAKHDDSGMVQRLCQLVRQVRAKTVLETARMQGSKITVEYPKDSDAQRGGAGGGGAGSGVGGSGRGGARGAVDPRAGPESGGSRRGAGGAPGGGSDLESIRNSLQQKLDIQRQQLLAQQKQVCVCVNRRRCVCECCVCVVAHSIAHMRTSDPHRCCSTNEKRCWAARTDEVHAQTYTQRHIVMNTYTLICTISRHARPATVRPPEAGWRCPWDGWNGTTAAIHWWASATGNGRKSV